MTPQDKDRDIAATQPVRADRESRDTARAAPWQALAILGVVVAALAHRGGAVAFWGIPGLYIPALALVPGIYAVLIAISRG